MGFFKKYEGSIFPLIVFEISVMEKIFPSQIFQKLWVEKLILHRFWKIPLFPVILSWIIYDNELKTIKYISSTKSIRRENLRHKIRYYSFIQMCSHIILHQTIVRSIWTKYVVDVCEKLNWTPAWNSAFILGGSSAIAVHHSSPIRLALLIISLRSIDLLFCKW